MFIDKNENALQTEDFCQRRSIVLKWLTETELSEDSGVTTNYAVACNIAGAIKACIERWKILDLLWDLKSPKVAKSRLKTPKVALKHLFLKRRETLKLQLRGCTSPFLKIICQPKKCSLRHYSLWMSLMRNCFLFCDNLNLKQTHSITLTKAIVPRATKTFGGTPL